MHKKIEHLISFARAHSTSARFAGAVTAVATLGALVVVAHLDAVIARAVDRLAVGWLTEIIVEVSRLASTDVVMPLTAVAVLVLLTLRHWRGAAAVAVAVFGTQAVVAVIKALVTRPRPNPELAQVEAVGYSFPSAHSATAVALYLTLALIAAGVWRQRWRTVAYLAAALVVFAVGISRVYLGVHYSTDVLAGWLTGAVLVGGVWMLSARIPGLRGATA